MSQQMRHGLAQFCNPSSAMVTSLFAGTDPVNFQKMGLSLRLLFKLRMGSSIISGFQRVVSSQNAVFGSYLDKLFLYKGMEGG
jgi:hypothetical protein